MKSSHQDIKTVCLLIDTLNINISILHIYYDNCYNSKTGRLK